MAGLSNLSYTMTSLETSVGLIWMLAVWDDVGTFILNVPEVFGL